MFKLDTNRQDKLMRVCASMYLGEEINCITHNGAVTHTVQSSWGQEDAVVRMKKNYYA